MDKLGFLEKYNISQEELEGTPPAVLSAFINEIRIMTERIEELEARLNKNSSNSDKPPSSDPPYKDKPKPEKKKRKKRGAKKGHKGHRQRLLDPTEVHELKPEKCPCGCDKIEAGDPYYTHQVIEFPEINMEVTHFILRSGKCMNCGAIHKAEIPSEHQTGFGPRLSALISEMAGTNGDSRTTVQNFCESVLGFHISLGAIQKVIDRVSQAIEPHYEEIAALVRETEINNVDETSWCTDGKLNWLWVMANSVAVFFMIHTNRSGEAFKQLIGEWSGILISDGYAVYCSWVGKRQTCLAHLIRYARGLSEHKDPEIAAMGKWALAELQRLCHMAHAPPTQGEWNAFYARLIHLITKYYDRQDDAGRFARRLFRELDSLWTFLHEEGVSPTNNHAERMLRYAVLWRRCSQGTVSDKGNRWVERILTLKQTCRLRSVSTFEVLTEAVRCFFRNEKPDLNWI